MAQMTKWGKVLTKVLGLALRGERQQRDQPAGRRQMLNEEPQPQVDLALGLVTWKREPSRPSL